VQIAIDGPVASGKSTVARLLADRLGCLFLDTGALYRAVAYAALQRGIAPDDDHTIASFAKSVRPVIVGDSASPVGYRIRIDGRAISEELFTPAVSSAVSSVAANAIVRTSLISTQRDFARERDVVMAGRDIGSVVLPDARFKFFLTASLDARVDRRLKELHDKGIAIERDTLRSEIERRDERDKNRKASPLIIAPDAMEIDTSAMSVGEVVDRLAEIVESGRDP
jgi:CMP/dCMP kinase